MPSEMPTAVAAMLLQLLRHVGYLHLSGLLEEITMRFDDVLAKVPEQHRAQVFG